MQLSSYRTVDCVYWRPCIGEEVHGEENESILTSEESTDGLKRLKRYNDFWRLGSWSHLRGRSFICLALQKGTSSRLPPSPLSQNLRTLPGLFAFYLDISVLDNAWLDPLVCLFVCVTVSVCRPPNPSLCLCPVGYIGKSVGCVPCASVKERTGIAVPGFP